jgi:hypothetical protein
MTEDLLRQLPCGGGREPRPREPPDVRPQTFSDHARTLALDRLVERSAPTLAPPPRSQRPPTGTKPA